MKNLFVNKNPLCKTFIYSLIFGFLLILFMIPLFIFKHFYIPLGIFIGLFINSVAYLLLFVVEQKEQMSCSVKISITINILRFVVIAGIIVLFAVLEYVFKIKIANVFAIVGGYFIPLIVYIVFSSLDGVKHGRKN